MKTLLLASLLAFLVHITSATRKPEQQPEDEQNIDNIEWWKKSNFYHIYLRSFRDSNGDGNGDFRGVIEKLDYLQLIGVETILMAPFYSSPMKDGGYDIDDYLSINPMFGTMRDFDQLVEELRRRQMRIVVDFVPNHSSNRHAWFECSERALVEPARCAKYRDYYVWSNSTRYQGQYPSNWVSVFGGGPAWQWSEVRKEFYLHQFLPEQPDLNFSNPEVREEFKEIARFWLRKGADGLRVDAPKHLLEETSNYPDEPEDPNWRPGDDPADKLKHIYTRGLAESADLVRDWHEVCQEKEFEGQMKVIMTEVYDDIPGMIMYYGKSPVDRYAELPFNFELMKLTESNLNSRNVEWTALNWIRATRKLGWPDEKGAMSPWISWVTSNHDNPRLANKVGLHNVVALRWLAHLLPGVPVNYYGDELSMHDSNYNDIPARTLAEGESSRLVERAPIAWTGEEPAGGFSSTADIWVPLNGNWHHHNVQSLLSNSSHPTNPLKLHLRLERIRRQYLSTLVFGDLVFYPSGSESLLAMGRVSDRFGSLLMLVNYDHHNTLVARLSGAPSEIQKVSRTPPARARVLLANFEDPELPLRAGVDVEMERLLVGPSQAAILHF